MVNLVVVSHSAKLAEGVAELAAQMIQGGCRLATAAGVDDEAHPIGTDAVKIMTAIEEVYDPSGVVVLMDLGSALLSAETALELLDPAMATQVRLCAAPLVEGTLAAAVAASSGGALDMVMADAVAALTAKQAQLGDAMADDGTNAPPGATTLAAGSDAFPRTTASAVGSNASPGATTSAAGFNTPPPGSDARRTGWRVANPQGLHARPAARLVSTLAPFDARLTLEKAGRFADATRINQVAALQVRKGDEIVLYAEGEQADAALAAFLREAESGFGETFSTQNGDTLWGKAVTDLPVTASAWRLNDEAKRSSAVNGNTQTRSTAPDKSNAQSRSTASAEGNAQAEPRSGSLPMSLEQKRSVPSSGDIQQERQRFVDAIDQAQRNLEQLAAAISQRLGPRFAGIFEAQAMLLADEGLRAAVAEKIPRLGSAAAWRQETTAMAADYAGLQDEYLRVRELDIRDLQAAVLALLDQTPPPSPPDAECILVGEELFPSRLVGLDRARLAGIALAAGHPLSHTAILARAMGIPIVVGITGLLDRVEEGQSVTLDPAQGTLSLS
ncbi:dihydroxyacetone kinase phosphoryl donor subunit DhaM [Acerihabitans sp. KWT182]|uniref:phosphoenolpyruvate--glycerone phosphotransferase n=1 Tax=Acerihabitans sp. KWT182 TaxID=3157919 RepID=A0AAU7Q9Q0_9GAMM